LPVYADDLAVRIIKKLLIQLQQIRIFGAGLVIVVLMTSCVSRYDYSMGNRCAGKIEQRRDSTRTVAVPERRYVAPASLPAPLPAAAATVQRSVVTTHQSGPGLHSGELVKVEQLAQARGAIGADMLTEFIVTPYAHAGEVILNVYLSDKASFVRAEPPPTSVSGRKLTWTWFELTEGDVQNIKISLRPTGQGTHRTCYTIHALPMGCVSYEVGSASLAIEKSGPASAGVGEPISYNIIVRNMGNQAADNVVITDDVPSGMSHQSGQSQVSMPVGSLGPGESKSASLTLSANRAGNFINQATASSSNAGSVSATAPTRVVQPSVSITKSGPPMQFLGKDASYRITVSNSGDTALNGVTVTDNAPNNARITGASGTQVSGSQATWSVGTLGAGQSRSFDLALTALAAGTTVNSVSVQTAEGVSDQAQAQTVWRGFPAVLIELVDDPDPLRVGETSTYTLRVTNQGTAPDHNVRALLRFPAGIQPISGSGTTPVKVSGGLVSFGLLQNIDPKQVATWTVQAKAVAIGDARISAEVNTDVLKGKPVSEIESTQVF
jgi:uncharacterized repeat protein (TIGR01451 family)